MLVAFGTRLDLPRGWSLAWAICFPRHLREILGEPGLDLSSAPATTWTRRRGGRTFYLLPHDTLEDCYRALDNYFQSMLAMAASPCYDVVGHVIYPLRYMNGPYDTPQPGPVSGSNPEILRLAIQSGRGIEINTWKGRRSGNGFPFCGITGS